MYIIHNINFEHLCPTMIFIFNLSTVTKFWTLINNGDFQTMQITFQIQQLNSNRIINRLLDKFFFMKFGNKKSNIIRTIFNTYITFQLIFRLLQNAKFNLFNDILLNMKSPVGTFPAIEYSDFVKTLAIFGYFKFYLIHIKSCNGVGKLKGFKSTRRRI